MMNREDRCQVPSKDVAIAPPLPPTDLMYMAAVAEKAGLESRIIDYTIDDLSLEQFIADLKSYRPDFLILSITTPTIKQDLQACTAAKNTLPSVRTIAKGAHFLRFNTQILESVPDLDLIIRGEPEETIQELFNDKPLPEITGLTWRSPAGIINNPDRRYQDDLDSLPFPARHLINNTRYVRPDNGKPQAIIKVARGCPFNCFFCLATPVSGAKVRQRSPGNIIEEIRQCVEQYGITNFLFWSDIFNIERDWVIRLCEAILNSGLKISWATNTRADTLDLEMALLMKQAGCTLVSIGVESGNEEILGKIGKKTDLQKIRNTFKVIRKAGLQSFAYYVIGLPWDTKETIEDTIKLAIELDSDYANFFTATAFPGTRYFEYGVQNHLFEPEEQQLTDLFSNAYRVPTLRGHHLSKEEIVSLQNQAVRRFFFRPAYILKTIVKIQSFRELIRYAKSGLSLTRHLTKA
jgi:radical SAM superfamily enzyme YgiQ (UPF0313 family)